MHFLEELGQNPKENLAFFSGHMLLYEWRFKATSYGLLQLGRTSGLSANLEAGSLILRYSSCMPKEPPSCSPMHPMEDEYVQMLDKKEHG